MVMTPEQLQRAPEITPRVLVEAAKEVVSAASMRLEGLAADHTGATRSICLAYHNGSQHRVYCVRSVTDLTKNSPQNGLSIEGFMETDQGWIPMDTIELPRKPSDVGRGTPGLRGQNLTAIEMLANELTLAAPISLYEYRIIQESSVR